MTSFNVSMNQMPGGILIKALSITDVPEASSLLITGMQAVNKACAAGGKTSRHFKGASAGLAHQTILTTIIQDKPNGYFLNERMAAKALHCS